MRRTAVRASMGSLVASVFALALTPGGVTIAGANSADCTPVVHTWVGRVAVDAGASFHTGTIVPTQIGVRLVVGASDVSTDEPPSGRVTLSIGETLVEDGAEVVGGEISVSNTSSEPIMLTRVEISLNECTQVDVAPPLPPVLSVPALPATGSPWSLPTGVSAAVLTAAGSGLLLLRRRPGPAVRRATGCDLGR